MQRENSLPSASVIEEENIRDRFGQQTDLSSPLNNYATGTKPPLVGGKDNRYRK